MPDCNYCGRFINTSSPAWICGCEVERAACRAPRIDLTAPKKPTPQLEHLPLFVRSYTGRYVRVTRVCIGQKAANEYIEANPGEGLLATCPEFDADDGTLCFIARLDDLGV